MARKPSRIARHGYAVFAIASLCVVARLAHSQEVIRVSSEPAPVITNQFATGGGQQPATAAIEPGPSTRAGKTYKNPFATMPSSPPLNVPLRAGPISRWQRSASSVKTRVTGVHPDLSPAMLPTVGDPVGQAAINWDRLPPAEEMRAMKKSPGASFDMAATLAGGSPPDPVQFAPVHLTQPAWMLPDTAVVNADAHSGETQAAAAAILDPFEMPIEPAAGVETAKSMPGTNEPAVFHASGGTLTLRPTEASNIAPSADNLLSLMIADGVDTPDGWYARAERMAQTAATREEFLSVAELCQQGLQTGASAETAKSLRRLAAWAYNRCGELWINAGQPPKALVEFQTAIALDPNCALAIHNRGVTFAQQDKPADALRDFNRVIELNPGLAVAYRNRAELLTSLGRMDEALRDYDRALVQLNEDAELYRARAYARQRLGRIDDALADLNTSVRLAPNEANTYTQRGILAAERGDYEQAIRDFQRAIDLDPHQAEAYRGLAWLMATCPDAQFRDGKKALSLAERSIQLAARPDCYMLDALAAAHASVGQFDQATAAAQQALTASPAEVAGPIRQRLRLYQQHKPFVNESPATVRTVSHESPPRRSPLPTGVK